MLKDIVLFILVFPIYVAILNVFIQLGNYLKSKV